MSDNYTWHFGLIWDFRGVFLRGAGVTLSLAVGALLIAMVLGLILGMLRSSKRRYLSAPTMVYIEFFRSTPTLVQLPVADLANGAQTSLERNLYVDTSTYRRSSTALPDL